VRGSSLLRRLARTRALLFCRCSTSVSAHSLAGFEKYDHNGSVALVTRMKKKKKKKKRKEQEIHESHQVDRERESLATLHCLYICIYTYVYMYNI